MQEFRENVSLPISIRVWFPSTSITSVLPEGSAEGCPLLAKDVPKLTLLILNLSTGVSFSITLSVLSLGLSLRHASSLSSYSLGKFSGAR